METNEKQFRVSLFLMLILLIVSVKIPYSDKVIIQILIFGFMNLFMEASSNLVNFICGILLLGGWIWSISQLIKSKKFKTNGLIIVLVLLVVIVPVLEVAIHYGLSSFYTVQEGVDSVELVDSKLYLFHFNDPYTAAVEIQLEEHNSSEDDLEVTIILPEEMQMYFVEDTFVIDRKSRAYSSTIEIIKETYELQVKDGVDEEILDQIDFDDCDYEIVFKIGDQERSYIRNNNN